MEQVIILSTYPFRTSVIAVGAFMNDVPRHYNWLVAKIEDLLRLREPLSLFFPQ